jgi:hypothetical protein
MIVAAVLVLLAVAVFLRSKAPPEPARLLPECDGIIYINLRPMRVLLRGRLKPSPHSPEYQQFINATGIDWERDLDQAAIGLKRMENPNGPNGPVAYSMVLVGKLTGSRLNGWLAAHSASRDTYAGKTIYNIPSEGRTVRVAQIGYDMVAVSNTPTPEQIHSIIDRHETAAWPFAESTLLRRYYHEMPLLSVAWGMGQIGLPFAQNGELRFLGFTLPTAPEATLLASVAPTLKLQDLLRLRGSLRLRVEELAGGTAAAASQAADLSTMVTMVRAAAAGLAASPLDNGLKELLKTAVVKQQSNRVVMTATLPVSFLAGLAQSQKSLPPTAPATGAAAPQSKSGQSR